MFCQLFGFASLLLGRGLLLFCQTYPQCRGFIALLVQALQLILETNIEIVHLLELILLGRFQTYTLEQLGTMLVVGSFQPLDLCLNGLVVRVLRQKFLLNALELFDRSPPRTAASGRVSLQLRLLLEQLFNLATIFYRAGFEFLELLFLIVSALLAARSVSRMSWESCSRISLSSLSRLKMETLVSRKRTSSSSMRRCC